MPNRFEGLPLNSLYELLTTAIGHLLAALDSNEEEEIKRQKKYCELLYAAIEKARLAERIS